MPEKRLEATSLNKEKGRDEFADVEALIQETIAESKILEKKKEPAATPPSLDKSTEDKPEDKPKEAPSIEAKKDFKATEINLPKKGTQAPPPARQEATPLSKPKSEAAQYENTFKEYRAGDIVKGTVLKIDPNGVLVDINYKADGLIPTEELSEKTSLFPKDAVKIGEVIDVYIENLENKEGYVILSKKRADDEMRWNSAYNAYKDKTLLEGKVIQILKGGLLVDCNGIRGFIPASQVLKKSQESLESFQDMVLPVKVLEINRRQGRIVLSHKLAAGESEQFSSSKTFAGLEVGQIRKGTVSSLKSFGAFINLGGVEGLIHLSELSWKRVKHPSEVLKVGQDIDVFVLGVDTVNKKVALGLKELQPDPWVNAADHFKPGQIVKVKILRFAKFGAFAELPHGLEGLIHISELSRAQVQSPGEAVKIGDEVEVKILRVLPEEQKIGLSIRQAQQTKEKEEAKKNIPPPEEENKITIADMIAQKDKERAEKEAQEEDQGVT
ncbi:hypothetical protein A3H38_05470 [candidate division WOR-1 bacterium RIFCSPLOWO2_02_FULL_46_20]|uniref:S1 motif domain-containing protein n=2 Tax=Saganbacteria TaxID=1703751 RepID=A0A1F4RES4_UNCSA|nr:MAG: hypothetical protein A3H38_05470 [candidate division WOR-1 bacterium RIFCSPLOWO2_02_FULL_46_20]OGC09597.1 MAG: hypothetical protein A3F86_06350 [candidate division WOR-1 bacterium RIFCSPLOWO2_12_FULL_45_9]